MQEAGKGQRFPTYSGEDISREDKLKTIKAWGLIKMRWHAQRGEGYLTLTLTLLVLSPLLTLQERKV